MTELVWKPAGSHGWGDCLVGESETIKCTIHVNGVNAELVVMMSDRDMLHMLDRLTFTPTQIKAGRVTFVRSTVDPNETVLESAKKWAQSVSNRIRLLPE